MNQTENPLLGLSEALAQAAALGGAATVLVDARKRLPASGIAYSSELVLTADHVVERDEDLRVLLPDGTALSATLAGRDPGSDLALLRVTGGALTPAVPADSPARVGQLALALGRPNREGIQASLGVVSAIGGPARTGRGGMLEQYLRTDTIPYPGFSGGPLVDVTGHVLGINTSGLAAGGAALTIPVGPAWRTAETLARHGRMRRGYLGVASRPAAIGAAQRQALGREQAHGLLLMEVEENGPAAQGGLMVGDLLTAIGGSPVSDPDELLARLAGETAGQVTPIEILRGGQRMEIAVKIGERS